jgi:hypothetical protein
LSARFFFSNATPKSFGVRPFCRRPIVDGASNWRARRAARRAPNSRNSAIRARGAVGGDEMAAEGEGTQLFRVYRTVCEMLDMRGYLIPPEDLNISLDEFKKKFGEPPS